MFFEINQESSLLCGCVSKHGPVCPPAPALPSVPRPLVTRPCPGPSGVVNEHAPSGQSPNGQAGPALSADLNTPQVSSWPAKFEGLQSRRIEGPYLGLLPV